MAHRGTRVGEILASCVSGREALARGRERDLKFAVNVDASQCVPLLQEGFIDAVSQPERSSRALAPSRDFGLGAVSD